MVRTSILNILAPHFSLAAHLSEFAVGLAIGISSWRWGSSRLPAWALMIATGFGGVLVFSLCIAAVLAMAALLMKNRAGYLAYGDFRNVLAWLLKQLLRSAAVFFGLVLIAAICWATSGSDKALITAMAGTLLGGALAYCWAGLVIISDELAKRTWTHARF